MLQQVNAQHALQADRRAAVAGLGVVRLDQRDQIGPRHQGLHLGQEGIAPRRLAVLLEARGSIAAAARLICFIAIASIRVDTFNACNYDAEDLISESLAPFGRMVVYGQASRQPAHVDTQRLVVPNHSITGFYLGAYIGRRDLIRSTLEELIGYVLDKRLELQVGAVLPLARASEAHRLLEGRKTTGKVVLQPWAEGG